MLDDIASILNGVLLPLVLLSSGIYFGVRYRFFYLLHPLRTVREAVSGTGGGGVSPLKSLALSLAGTLGVGNISGVAAAIACGGAGAVFWMWVSALAAMGVKYAEVGLAVGHRRQRNGENYGGAMYYIEDTVAKRGHAVLASVMGGGFAFLLFLNSLLTGNSVQVSAAAETALGIKPIYMGIFFGVLAAFAAVGGLRRAAYVSAAVIPILSLVYILCSLYVILTGWREIPRVTGEILRSAFSLRSVGGGVLGTGTVAAARYGVSRGLFSNEAGLGTAPTSHAASSNTSAHSQGCLGIFEVAADTVILCTLTAYVILIESPGGGLSGIALAIAAYTSGAGVAVGRIISWSVVLFAAATVICQGVYGVEALYYFSRARYVKWVYAAMAAGAAAVGGTVGADAIWGVADILVAVMYIGNVYFVCRESRQLLPLKRK